MRTNSLTSYLDKVTFLVADLQLLFGEKVSSLYVVALPQMIKIFNSIFFQLQVHNGPPHDSNFGYSYAKRMIDIQNKYVQISLFCP